MAIHGSAEDFDNLVGLMAVDQFEVLYHEGIVGGTPLPAGSNRGDERGCKFLKHMTFAALLGNVGDIDRREPIQMLVGRSGHERVTSKEAHQGPMESGVLQFTRGYQYDLGHGTFSFGQRVLAVPC